jgi:hypothetical protein
MWARVATFEGDPGNLDERVRGLRAAIDSGELPAEITDAKLLLLVDRESGGMLAVTLYDSEEALHKGDAALNARAGTAGTRSSVEFYEVPIQTL